MTSSHGHHLPGINEVAPPRAGQAWGRAALGEVAPPGARVPKGEDVCCEVAHAITRSRFWPPKRPGSAVCLLVSVHAASCISRPGRKKNKGPLRMSERPLVKTFRVRKEA